MLHKQYSTVFISLLYMHIFYQCLYLWLAGSKDGIKRKGIMGGFIFISLSSFSA